MEVFVVSLLNGLVYGMLLFMLASGLTLILSMMGVLNFAHASAYMLGAYRAFMLAISALMFGAIWLGLARTRVGLVIQAALTHPDMASALGHNVPRIFTLVFAAGTALAGLAGVIGGNYQVTEPAMAFTMGPIVFVVVVFGGLGSLTGCFIASILMGLIQTFAVVFDVSLADLLARFGFVVTSPPSLAEILTVTLPRVGALLPFLMMVLILVFRPRGLMGTRDT